MAKSKKGDDKMSGYWGATSGTALVFQKEEVKDFFTRYLLETYRKDGVTDEDIDSIDWHDFRLWKLFLFPAFCTQAEPAGGFPFTGIMRK